MTLPGIRVLYVDCAPFAGGAQRSLLDMVQGMRDEGVEPLVLAADMSPEGVVAQCLRWHVPVEPIRARHWRRTPLGLCQFLVDRRRLGALFRDRIKVWQPDIVHANTLRAALLLPLRQLASRPLVIHDRDIRAPGPARAYLAGRAAAVLAIAAAVAETWPPKSAKRLHIVPNGLDVATIARTPPDPACIGQVALVADYIPWKGHELFLRAFALVAQRRREARAILVGRSRPGNETYPAELRKHIRKFGLDGRVTLHDGSAGAWPQIAACRLLASCSPEEPFGRTIVEALALGKPVVAVRGGGPGEILAGCPAARLVEATPEALAEGMLEAWDWGEDPTRRQRARQRADDYSIRHMSQRIRAIYHNLLDRHPQREKPGT